MKILFETPQILAKESLLSFVSEKVRKLASVSDRISEARVTLRLDARKTAENKICAIRGVVPGNDLFVEKEASSFEEAALRAVDALKRQLIDWKATSGV